MPGCLVFFYQKTCSDHVYTLSKAAKFGLAQAIYFQGGFIFFGGYGTDIVSRLTDKSYQWSKLGTLTTMRTFDKVARMNNDFYLIGGKGKLPIEKCTFESTKVNCTRPGLSLTDVWTPETLNVDTTYCQK